MTDRPIIFSTPMVRALLEDRKSQTRRVLKPQPPEGWKFVGIYAPGLTAVFDSDDPLGPPDWALRLPYMPGDRLWVREAFNFGSECDEFAPSAITEPTEVRYRATDGISPARLRPSIHMPRWASRLTLIVSDVRVQRVQEISEDDAEAEGVKALWTCLNPSIGSYAVEKYATEEFRDLWDSINAKKPGCSWADNPWVCALTFTVYHQNIGQMQHPGKPAERRK